MTTEQDAAVSVRPSECGVELATYGWCTWPKAVELLTDSEGVWLGTAGIVECAASAWPADMPVTTRIHAWGTGPAPVLWRLIPRPTAQTVLVTGLILSPTTPQPATPGAKRAAVVSTEHSLGWLRYRVGGPSTLTFLRRMPLDTADPW
ncbi:hypothetical protein MLP_11460 [Microlunatus phosphovorus NM-1]|uniref:Uncharacterized protein n=1 Tax=Microlunatus phosphovorus (strain ATCC 700054 / DSM 10555 / JCM 9379 / NBRC 101784 / NCIMB 13414 / VKM Ac-1990 / NM-1) TaxID=1032480 RepID=F5XNP6_MICPN|nr:hypothetical protein [Microlunatus phosphovorus]BAK34160.1 hypothetical protein MLP_11460 [Microlunatus phosphovorus NM-1]